MLLKRGLIYHDIAYDTAITVTESESDIRITRDTPYLALTIELWVSLARILEKIDCVIKAPHCIEKQNNKHHIYPDTYIHKLTCQTAA